MTIAQGSPPPIECVDVFCGAGGLTHGLARGGIDVRAGFDMDPACRFPYEANNDAFFALRDVRELSGAEIAGHFSSPGATRLLAGCAPCQAFSTYSRAGRRHRCDGRWGLLSEFGRLVREVRPDLVTMENVPEVVRHAVFQRFLADLADYRVSYSIVDCTRHGIPQTRRRLVLLASRSGDLRFPEGSSVVGTVRSEIAALPPLDAGQADPRDALHTACGLSPRNLERIRASRPGGTWREWTDDLAVACHRKASGNYYASVYGRMQWDKPAPTITTQSFGFGNGRFGHPEQDRAITLREAAILQTFPPAYRFLPEGRKPVFHVLGRLIGNAVPVRLGEVIAGAFRAHVETLSA